MLSNRWGRWAPLTGVVFVVLVVLGGPIAGGNSPGSKATGAHVIAFFDAHRSRERASAVLLTLAFIVFMFFAGSLRSYLRRTKAVEGLAAVVLAAAAVLVAGQTAGSGVIFALSDAPTHLSPAAAQALNLLSNDMVLTSAPVSPFRDRQRYRDPARRAASQMAGLGGDLDRRRRRHPGRVRRRDRAGRLDRDRQHPDLQTQRDRPPAANQHDPNRLRATASSGLHDLTGFEDRLGEFRKPAWMLGFLCFRNGCATVFATVGAEPCRRELLIKREHRRASE